MIRCFKIKGFILLIAFLAVSPLACASTLEANDSIEITPTENHHIIALNSNQPYVAGYHVDTLDLLTRERVDATAVTISFPLVDTSYFPAGSWLGGGMFVQGQDERLRHVDYAFYMMLVLDASGVLFLDLGLHETRESSAPLQMPTEELIYAYTWQVSGIAPSVPVTLLARWDSEGFVHYSISASGTNITLLSVNVANLPTCESIQRHFYSGNRATTSFPFGHNVYYFQFGVVSSEVIENNHWSIDLKNPKILRRPESRFGTGWSHVNIAWSTQGDISYLDGDWKWGGAPYYGVSAHYYQNPLENPCEVIFFYNGQTLRLGTILWQHASSEPNSVAVATPVTLFDETFKIELTSILSIEIMVLIGIAAGKTRLCELRKKLKKT